METLKEAIKRKHRSNASVLLSSGRTIAHSPLANGAIQATPTTGPAELTDQEWEEYRMVIRDRAIVGRD